MKKHVLIFTPIIILLQLSLHAQSWQWGILGGSNQDILNGPAREEISHITTDNHGNVYAVSRVAYSNYIRVDGHPINLPSNINATAVFSYTCDGTFRWGKLLQVRSVSNLATDTLGGVYIGGGISSAEFFSGSFTDYDADTMWPIYSNDMKFLVLVKLDTLGNLQWIRQPQPDTLTFASPQSLSVDLEVEKDGTIHWMNVLFPANYAGTGLIVTTPGCYMLKYDRNGTFTGSTPIALNYTPFSYVPICFFSHRLRYSKNNNRYIVTGNGDANLTINGTTINQMLFVASFDAVTGNPYWAHQASGIFCNIANKVAVDEQNNIYLTGTLGHGYSFNGFTQNNQVTTIPHSIPFLQKMDANGNALWTRGTSAGSGMSACSVVLSDSVVALTNGYGPNFKWNNGNQSFHSTSQSTGINTYLTRFNRFTGNYIHTDTIGSTNSAEEYGLALAADRDANFYVGIRLESNVIFNGLNIYSAGGIYDFFLAKFGNATCGPQSPIGLNTTEKKQDMAIYPNPATSQVTIDHLPLHSELILSDAMGRKLQSVVCFDAKQTLSIAHLRPGIYFIQVKNGNTCTTRKIIVE